MNTSTLAETYEEVTSDDELDRLKEAEEKLHEHEQEVIANCDLPLTFEPFTRTWSKENDGELWDDKDGELYGYKVASGILWINGPFAVDLEWPAQETEAE